ncbi:MAG TPA: SpoIIE family protein phosphatase [Thermoanaerobaculia bacterium]
MTSTTLTAAPRTYGWRSWRNFIDEVLLGAIFGIVISFIESGGTRELPPMHTLARNIILGISVFVFSRGLETMLSWAIEQSRIPTLFRSILYAVGGWLGYAVGVVVAGSVVPGESTNFGEGTYHIYYSLAAATLGAVTSGFVLHHNRKRNDRLRASIERLKEHEFAEKELEIARSMQQRLLPPPLVERDGWRVTARTHAAHMVGGDFYDVLRAGDDTTAILAADVSGKGIAASLIMASCKAMVPFLLQSGGAAEVMNALNHRLCEQLERREFVAMAFARYVAATGELELANAGMPDPLLISRDGTIRPIVVTGDRLPLGAMRVSRYHATRVTLEVGDRLLIFSDGLPEATTDEGTLGYDRVEAMVASMKSVEGLIDDVRAVATVEDDLTVVMLERL